MVQIFRRFEVAAWVLGIVLGLFVVTSVRAEAEASRPLSLFPTATSVRVYGAPTSLRINVDAQGHVVAQQMSADDESVIQVPAKDGGWLTVSEIKQIRAAVWMFPPPDVLLTCCSPRHIFLFYDHRGHYLGHFSVCFECGCAEMMPLAPTDPNMNWIGWRHDAFASVVEAHHLGPLLPPR